MRWPLLGAFAGVLVGTGFFLWDEFFAPVVVGIMPGFNLGYIGPLLLKFGYIVLIAMGPGLALGCLVSVFAAVFKRSRAELPTPAIPEVGPRWSDQPEAKSPSDNVQPHQDGLSDDTSLGHN
jgi:hypothetical protein